MYIAKELPLPRANRNLLFNPSELYSNEIDILESSEDLTVKTKKTFCINHKTGGKKLVKETNLSSAK